jgi:hypothetical protein
MSTGKREVFKVKDYFEACCHWLKKVANENNEKIKFI